MGTGIAQVAAQNGYQVKVYDIDTDVLAVAKEKLRRSYIRLVQKGKLDQATADTVLKRITLTNKIESLVNSDFVIEAVVENIEVKKRLFFELEANLPKSAVITTNTSSLSVTSIASVCRNPERVVGTHFFNPAPLMPLVEIVPAIQTRPSTVQKAKELMDDWNKVSVIAKDTPGFIVNRVARPFYGEALRLYEEGFADFPTIDWAMKEFGGFRMGPFELMDLIGNDINYTVTETVFEQFYYEPRFRPSFFQKRIVEANRLGKKNGLGFYSYKEGAQNPEPDKDRDKGEYIFDRILYMLINEAADALFMGIASKEDIDLAMTKGVNYPKGLLKWADEIGIENVIEGIKVLSEDYGEDRYRVNPLLKKMRREKSKFYEG